MNFQALFPISLSELAAALTVGGLCALALLRRHRMDRRGASLSLALLLPGLVTMVIGSLLQSRMDAPRFGAGLAEAGLLMFGFGSVRLFGQALFQFVLLPCGIPRIVEDLAIFACYLGWALLRLHAAGMEISQLLTTSAVVTAVLALSLQDTLGNLLGGLALELDDSFMLGDWIRLDDIAGRIVEVRWRSTSIETRNGETVVIPNSLLIRSRFHVVGKRTDQPLQWRRWIWFHVDYGVDPTEVIRTVEHAVQGAGLAHVSADPAASCLFMDFDASSARFALRYWLQRLDLDDSTDSVVRCEIHRALLAAGITPAVPRQEVLLQQPDQDEAIRGRDAGASGALTTPLV